MDFSVVLYAALFLVSLSLLYGRHRRPGKKFPPSPPAIPLLGHLHLIKQPAHRSLAALSERYGPIMALRFGSRPVLIVSSAAAAKECFSRNDIVFANRPPLLAAKMLGYEYTTLFWAPYGPHWRNVRRLAMLEFLSTSRLQDFVGVREEEVHAMMNDLALIPRNHKVLLRTMLFQLALNIMMRTLCGKKYYGKEVADEEEVKHLEEIVHETVKLSSASNVGDFVPVLGMLGPAGLEKKLAKLSAKRDSFMQSLLDQYRSSCNGDVGERTDTVMGVMVKLQQEDPKYYTDEIIKGMIMGLLTAGTDTTVSTIEWAMAELVSQPDVLAKARAELDSTVGSRRVFQESDLTNLRFMSLIIKETLRLHPAAAIIPAHLSSDHCTVGGFDVAPGTMLLVNAWDIHRDKNVWEDPEMFRPGRFENIKRVETMMPFGLGRRRCPGEGLAMRVVGLVLGMLIHCFEWDLGDDGVMDLREAPGLTTPMARPLEVLCKPRAFVSDLLCTTTTTIP